MRQVGIASVVKKWFMYEKDITENEINKFKFKYLREQKNKWALIEIGPTE